jgi:hypothetical protein
VLASPANTGHHLPQRQGRSNIRPGSSGIGCARRACWARWDRWARAKAGPNAARSARSSAGSGVRAPDGPTP